MSSLQCCAVQPALGDNPEENVASYAEQHSEAVWSSWVTVRGFNSSCWHKRNL